MAEKKEKRYVSDNAQLIAEWEWWKCSKGQEWEATIASRNYGRNCPQCAREKHKK